MKIDVGEMLGILPKEILELEKEYNEFSKLGYNSRYDILSSIIEVMHEQGKEQPMESPEAINVFQSIFKSTIRKAKKNNFLDKDIFVTFILDLIVPFDFQSFYDENEEQAQNFILKLADVMVKYGGYKMIHGMSSNNPCYNFWAVYKEVTDEKEYLTFLRKINTEVREIIDRNDEKSDEELLPKVGFILNFFYLMSINSTKEVVDELDKITVILLNLCTKYEYKLDCLSYPRVPLTYIFGYLDSKETKNLIMRYLMEYADYFQGLEMDSRECVINTVYPDEEKSEVLRMYLENALLLKREDLYSGPVFDKVFNKLFREVEAERNGELYGFGEDSPTDFSKALLVIEEICNNPDSFKMLADTDFFDKVYEMFNYFILVYYNSKKSVDLQPALESQYLNDTESKMKLSFFKLCLTIRRQQSEQKLQGEFRLKS